VNRKAILEFQTLTYPETDKVVELLSLVPEQDRGYLLLAIIVGKAEGESAREFRELAERYIQKL
jgi:hypothetical protein